MNNTTQKGSVSIAFVVLLIISLGALGYIVLQEKDSRQPQEKQPATQIPTEENKKETTRLTTPNIATEDAPPTNQVTEVSVSVPIDWQKIETANFILSIPPHWSYNELDGTDSYVAEITGDNVRLTFDYGWYSNPLAEDTDPNHVVSYELIDGYTAKIVLPKTSTGSITGVYFGNLGNTYGQNIRFQMSGYDLPEPQQQTALTIFRTLQFKEK